MRVKVLLGGTLALGVTGFTTQYLYREQLVNQRLSELQRQRTELDVHLKKLKNSAASINLETDRACTKVAELEEAVNTMWADRFERYERQRLEAESAIMIVKDMHSVFDQLGKQLKAFGAQYAPSNEYEFFASKMNTLACLLHVPQRDDDHTAGDNVEPLWKRRNEIGFLAQDRVVGVVTEAMEHQANAYGDVRPAKNTFELEQTFVSVVGHLEKALASEASAQLAGDNDEFNLRLVSQLMPRPSVIAKSLFLAVEQFRIASMEALTAPTPDPGQDAVSEEEQIAKHAGRDGRVVLFSDASDVRAAIEYLRPIVLRYRRRVLDFEAKHPSGGDATSDANADIHSAVNVRKLAKMRELAKDVQVAADHGAAWITAATSHVLDVETRSVLEAYLCCLQSQMLTSGGQQQQQQ